MDDKKKQLKVIIPSNIQGGVFSNIAHVSASQREVVIDFAFLQPDMSQAVIVSRVILTKEHAFELKKVLENVLKKYEQKKRAK